MPRAIGPPAKKFLLNPAELVRLFGPLDNAQEEKFDKRFSEILGSG